MIINSYQIHFFCMEEFYSKLYKKDKAGEKIPQHNNKKYIYNYVQL